MSESAVPGDSPPPEKTRRWVRKKTNNAGMLDEASHETKTVDRPTSPSSDKHSSGGTRSSAPLVAAAAGARQTGSSPIVVLRDLIPRLHVHMADDSLIKGWEAEKRIFKNGKDRGPLRAAARDIRVKAVAEGVWESGERGTRPALFRRKEEVADYSKAEDDPEQVGIKGFGAGKNGKGKGKMKGQKGKAGTEGGLLLHPAERAYLFAIKKLYEQLVLAKEQDFDAHLRDGLEWCEAILQQLETDSCGAKQCSETGRGGVGSDSDSRQSGGTTQQVSSGLCMVPDILLALSPSQSEASAKLLASLKTQRAAGHRGRAIDRDLKYAARCADEARKLWGKMRELQIGGLVSAQEEPIENVQKEYLVWLEKLLSELAREGEPDFDGMLRNGINFLEGGGKKKTW